MAKKVETIDKVMQFVEEELARNPNVQTSDLQEKARSVDASVGKLTLRQFNARYPLQVKRKQVASRPGRRRSASTRRGRGRASGNREAMRKVLLGFAADLVAAEARTDLVKLLAGVDRYVDQVLKAARK